MARGSRRTGHPPTALSPTGKPAAFDLWRARPDREDAGAIPRFSWIRTTGRNRRTTSSGIRLPPPSPRAPSGPSAVKLKVAPTVQASSASTGPRRDIPEKVDGRARYGIDVQAARMIYAMVETGPVQGATPASIEDAAARATPGVIDVIRLPHGVAVAGDSIFAVRDARGRLRITWDRGANIGGYDSGATLDDFSRIAADLGQAGVRVSEIGDPVAAAAVLADRTSPEHRIVTFEASSELVYHAPARAPERDGAHRRRRQVGRGVAGHPMAKAGPEICCEGPRRRAGDVRINTLFPGGSFGRRQEAGRRRRCGLCGAGDAKARQGDLDTRGRHQAQTRFARRWCAAWRRR